jgi:PKD repeat protein
MGLVSAARGVTHAYSSSGSYTITATARDNGNTFSNSTTVTVAPISVDLAVSLATVATVGSTATFTATVTGGTPQTFEWSFGDGTDSVKTSANKTSHVYTKNNPYTATVTVTMIDGQTVSGRVEFIVSGI